MKTKPGEFNQTISRLLTEKLKKFNDGTVTLNLVTCVEIYQNIFETLAELFETTQAPLSNESVNYLAQQYYDSILINNTQELDPNIFTQRAKLENIEIKELALLATMLSGTDFAIPIIQEVKKRS